MVLLLQVALHQGQQGQQALSSVGLAESPQGTGAAPVEVVELVVWQGAVVLEGEELLLCPPHLVGVSLSQYTALQFSCFRL